MVISLQNISKRFGFEWIFKNVNYQFEPGRKYAVVGPNGSGKSTLLKIISGGLTPSGGKVWYKISHVRSPTDELISREIAYAAPYISLIEDFTLSEMYDFHTSFKKMHCENADEFLEIIQLKHHRNKYIKNFSSGMRQRLKLGMAFLTQSQVLLLDEPTSNFDTKAIDWYLKLMENYTEGRIVVIGSNQEYEYAFCSDKLAVTDFK
jgi:ABC-type multidrug transport system ATPase subunit